MILSLSVTVVGWTFVSHLLLPASAMWICSALEQASSQSWLGRMTCFGQWNVGASDHGISKLRPYKVRGPLGVRECGRKAQGSGELEKAIQ